MKWNELRKLGTKICNKSVLGLSKEALINKIIDCHKIDKERNEEVFKEDDEEKENGIQLLSLQPPNPSDLRDPHYNDKDKCQSN